MGTDGNGSRIRTILIDYRKAFDLIDHRILVHKLCNLNIPRSVVNWIINFLSDRFQRIKLAQDCYSDWGSVPSGVPQGTKLGPWLFILMINDLRVSSPFLWKYVDDTTTSEIVQKGSVSNAQSLADEVICWSRINRVHINADKCKELRITFAKQPVDFTPVVMEGKELEVVPSVKLIGLNISHNLTWNKQVDEVLNKAGKRLYFLVQLKRAKVPPMDLIIFYKACIRSVSDYAIPAYFHALPKYLKNEIIRLEKRALAIILPGTNYRTACKVLSLTPIEEHHIKLCGNLFSDIVSDSKHKLHHLLPPLKDSNYSLRRKSRFSVPRVQTNRTKQSFLITMTTQCIICP